MIKCFSIDDEQAARHLLMRILSMTGIDAQLIGEASQLKEGIELAQQLQPDIIFLDINMPVENGLMIHKYKSLLPENCEIVFVTAYDEFAINAIRLSAFDYLLKPIQLDDLTNCLQRYQQSVKEKINLNNRLNNLDHNLHENQQHIVINGHNDTHFINIDDIQYLQADGMYSKIKLKDQTITTSKPIKYYVDLLPSDSFFRSHRSYLVNINWTLPKLNQNGDIVLKNNESIPLARLRKSEFIELLSKPKKTSFN